MSLQCVHIFLCIAGVSIFATTILWLLGDKRKKADILVLP